MAQTIATSLEKLNTALSGDKTALTEKKVSVPGTTKHSDVPKLIAQIKSGESSKISVECSEEYEGTTLTFTNGSDKITSKVVGGNCEVTVEKEGTWTVSNTVDSQTVSCVVEFSRYGLTLFAKPIVKELCSPDDFMAALKTFYNSSERYNLVFCHDPLGSSNYKDVSKDKDNSIVMWKEGDTIKVSGKSERIIINIKSCTVHLQEEPGEYDHGIDDYGSMFGDTYVYSQSTDSDYSDLVVRVRDVVKSIDFGNVDFTGTTSLAYAFRSLYRLESIDMSNATGLDTGKITNLSHFCYDCDNLKTVNFGSLNVSNVTNMYYAFYGTGTHMPKLDLSKWKNDKANNMVYMFGYASIDVIDITNFGVNNVYNSNNLNNMFYNSSVKTIYCNKNWSTDSYASKSTDVFGKCTNLTGYSSSKTSGAYAKPISSGGYFTTK